MEQAEEYLGIIYRLRTLYLFFQVNCDKIIQAYWDFDASSAQTQRVNALDKHQKQKCIILSQFLSTKYSGNSLTQSSWMNEENWANVPLLPTWSWESGYALEHVWSVQHEQSRGQGLPRWAYPKDQIEEDNEEKLEKKIGENNRRMRKTEQMFLSCPPEVDSLAMPWACVECMNPGVWIHTVWSRP